MRTERAEGLLNTPEITNFLEGIRRETAHQKERWGEIYDRKKSAEQWYWLIGYLASKALRAHITGDLKKAKHHTISTAAALANWHDFITHDQSRNGQALDPDEVLKPYYQ